MPTDDILSVSSLHALVYCERLFYLEEVERIRVADAAVFAGRTLHVEAEKHDPEGTLSEHLLESNRIGLRGRVDVLRKQSGQLVPVERKRGRSGGKKGAREAWPTDRVQLGAYAVLVEEAFGQEVREGRVRYAADKAVVTVSVTDELRAEVHSAIDRARQLRKAVTRPPVTPNSRLCVRCSLAPVCLPEETRLGLDPSFHPIRLHPPHQDRLVLHVAESGARVGRFGDTLAVALMGGASESAPIHEVGAVVLHGLCQITTQALRLCAENDVPVHWVTLGGGLVGSLAPTALPTQRHIRQFQALSDETVAMDLCRKLVSAKVLGQCRFLLRATRKEARSPGMIRSIEAIRLALRHAPRAPDREALLGVEGAAAAAYFGVLTELLSVDLDERLRFSGRTRRPPKDRINALLGYGYGMLYREVLQAICGVGLHPGFGFYHQPRSAAHPLALDVMELFRVPLVDMPTVAALNRKTFDPDADFMESPGQVLLSESGRRKAIEVFERRKQDVWRHDVVGYSLSYARMIELEVRLLEKHWSGEGSLFAKFRIR